MSVHATGGEFPLYEIEHARGRGLVAQQGAQVLTWEPAGQRPLLYLSPHARMMSGKPVRGGVPICWPWFGPDTSGQGLGAHGFLRTRLWGIPQIREDETGVRLNFKINDDAATREQWPWAFSAELEVVLGKTLAVELRVRNTSAEVVGLTGALHSYLAVGDVRQVEVLGLEGCRYEDELDGKKVKLQEGAIKVAGEVDRNYESRGEVVVRDHEWHRDVRVTSRGSGCTVVWNPWIEKAAALADLPDEGWRHFICVESANAFTDVVLLEPGATHVLSQEVTVVVAGEEDGPRL